MLAVSTFTLAGYLLGWIDFRFPAARPLLGGKPRIIVRHGEPNLEILAAERITIDDLHEASREKGIRSLREIELCVLEIDGKFSFFTTSSDEGHDGATHDKDPI